MHQGEDKCLYLCLLIPIIVWLLNEIMFLKQQKSVGVLLCPLTWFSELFSWNHSRFQMQSVIFAGKLKANFNVKTVEPGSKGEHRRTFSPFCYLKDDEKNALSSLWINEFEKEKVQQRMIHERLFLHERWTKELVLLDEKSKGWGGIGLLSLDTRKWTQGRENNHLS